jgi:hypothetical protein
MYLVSATPPKRKEYGCCPKFKRGDNSTYTFTKKGGGMYLVSATPTKLLIELL